MLIFGVAGGSGIEGIVFFLAQNLSSSQIIEPRGVLNHYFIFWLLYLEYLDCLFFSPFQVLLVERAQNHIIVVLEGIPFVFAARVAADDCRVELSFIVDDCTELAPSRG